MNTLVRTEWLKMKKYNAFWWIMGIMILSYPGINYMFYFAYKETVDNPSQYASYLKMGIGNPFSFPEVWHTVAYASSISLFIPAVVVIMLVCNEYTYRTHRQNIIDGWSRSQFVTSKLIDVLIITLIATALYTAISLIIGFAAHDRLIRDTWGMAYYIGLFALQTFAQLSIAFLLGFLIRKAFLALGAFLFLFFVLDNVLWALSEHYFKSSWGHYLPLEMSDRIIPRPAFTKITEAGANPGAYDKLITEIPQFIILTALLTTAIWWLCYRINNKKDLK